MKTINHEGKEYELVSDEDGTLTYKEVKKDFGLQGFDDSEGIFYIQGDKSLQVSHSWQPNIGYKENFATYPSIKLAKKASKLMQISNAFIKACLLVDPDFEPDFSDFNQAKYEVYYIPSSKCFDYIGVNSPFTITVSSEIKALRVMGFLESWGVDKLIDSLGDK